MICESVKGQRIADIQGRDDETGLWNSPPGTWRWRLNGWKGKRIMEGVLPSRYPDGPGIVHPYQMCNCLVIKGTSVDEDIPQWSWDGNIEKPTLAPSILVDTTWGEDYTRVFWHGYMDAGDFCACE